MTHPEKYCSKCGGKNPTWYAPNELFNLINGSPNGIICPSCFQEKADNKGINIIFQTNIVGDSVNEKLLLDFYEWAIKYFSFSVNVKDPNEIIKLYLKSKA